MDDEIRGVLGEIAEQEQVAILLAVESGSRAWGFPSTDSDYDVRFVYARRPIDYLSIYQPRDVIERPISGVLDVNGWDITKALHLFRKGNPPLREWLASPIVYDEWGNFATGLRILGETYFDPVTTIYHYLHMARRNFNQYLQGEQIPVKKYLYVLRPLLACKWVEDFQTFPPLAIETLWRRYIPFHSPLGRTVYDLLRRKREGEELDMLGRLSYLHTWIDTTLKYFEEFTRILRPEGAQIEPPTDALTWLLHDTLKAAWGAHWTVAKRWRTA